MAKQSVEDRMKRLEEGRCPVHGTAMVQIGRVQVGGKEHFLAECPRLACDIKATTQEPHGQAVLLDEFSHLIT